MMVVARETSLRPVHPKDMCRTYRNKGIIFPPVLAFYTDHRLLGTLCSRVMNRFWIILDGSRRGLRDRKARRVESVGFISFDVAFNSFQRGQILFVHINSLQTPNMIAAVPVQTPMSHCNVLNLTASNLSLNAAVSCSILVSVSLIFKS